MSVVRSDIAILGGGLAGGLVALALARLRPDLSITVTEQGSTFGGNHFWSFFATDLAADGMELVAPLIEASWTSYEVRFPSYRRVLETAYHTTTSRRLDAALRAALPASALLTGARVLTASTMTAELSDGRRIAADIVIDTRGIEYFNSMSGGWQVFLGQHLKLSKPHGLQRPVVMDATVPQIGGYRFVYCLPFSADEVLVEDTYYSNSPDLDTGALSARIADYAKAQGWQILGMLGEESGVLPVVAGGKPYRPQMACGGTRAGLFHPLTSYSLPEAVRFAMAFAEMVGNNRHDLASISGKYSSSVWNNYGFYRTLTAMLFAAAEPDERYKILERFYHLDRGLIERFYAGTCTITDKARILMGKPPVPISRAIGVLTGLGKRPAPLADRRTQTHDTREKP
ncbi:lycopene cyclase [Novosphingobium nitrogenifigens DSM 19370]|uniref:Lycopene cyclase n=1 Tax=Novosphingobium nitrogenifigens DSM 19370 TaxID=983920 RepID=F1ZA49_9SPHN|nr:lycopene beta-cyclase CrtY [Novosphingobium nitrogenifigens]EGD58543.1 lycopene cyclase [Novosphingobium nitrogenifigens DSM 19370]